jgi:hypothetical protein
MNTQPEEDPLPIATVEAAAVSSLLKYARATADNRLRRNVPILDADFDDIVPGYSDPDSWHDS